MALILMDVDGPLANFVQHVFATAGVSQPETLKAHYDVFDHFDPPVAAKLKNETLNSADWWEALPLVPYAKEGITDILEAGHRILYLTSPWYSCFGWESARRSWLRRHFGAKPRDVMCGAAKELVRGDVLIDDRPEHIQEWQAAFPEGRAFLYHMQHNREADLPRLDWAEIIRRHRSWL